MTANEPEIDIKAALRHLQRQLDQIHDNHAGRKDFSSRMLLSIAACGRSRAFTDAVVLAYEQKSIFLLGPLVRLQLDSLLRVYVSNVIDDGEHFATFVLTGGEVSKYPASSFPTLRARLSPEDPRLTDKAMCLLISKDWEPKFQRMDQEDPSLLSGYPDRTQFIRESFRTIYIDTNAYVHLSRNHLMDSIAPESFLTHLQLIGPQGATGLLESREAFMTDFMFITDALIKDVKLALGWPVTK